MISRTDFCARLSETSERLKTRIIYASRDDVAAIRLTYEQYTPGIEVIDVSEHVTTDGFFPAATRLFSDLKMQFANCTELGKMPFVIGLDGYLSLLTESGVRDALQCLKRELDKCGTGMNAVVFVLKRYWGNGAGVFSNPKYCQDGRIVLIGSERFQSGEPATDVSFIEESWADDPDSEAMTMCEYLVKREQGMVVSNPLIKVSFNGRVPFPQVNKAVRQLCTLKDWHGYKLGEDAEQLSECAYEWIHENIEWFDGLKSIENHFYPNGIGNVETSGLFDLTRTNGDAEFEVLAFYLRHRLKPTAYLVWVLSDTSVSRDTIFDVYVCKVRENLNTNCAENWRSERKQSIAKFEPAYVRTSLVHFIDLLKDVPCDEALRWLDFGTNEEKCECVRRIVDCGDDSVIGMVTEKYSDLGCYLSRSVSGHDEIDAYFEEYRRLKCLNVLDEDFCSKAFQRSGTHNQITSRNHELQQWHDDNDACVVIVDALGGEYLSMLIALAEANHLGIRDAKFVRASLPSSTEFNNIDFATQKVNGLDVICHQGVKPHEANTDEENFVGELTYISKNVLPVVQSALSKHKRVVLTADHGTSRLAVLAHRLKMSRTLDAITGCKPMSWRTATIDDGSTNIESADVVANLANTHVSVKGYNRFSYPGGCGFEIHGGATVEECIVPFVVFEKGATYVPPVTVKVETNAAQMTEDSDFDI